MTMLEPDIPFEIELNPGHPCDVFLENSNCLERRIDLEHVIGQQHRHHFHGHCRDIVVASDSTALPLLVDLYRAYATAFAMEPFDLSPDPIDHPESLQMSTPWVDPHVIGRPI